MTDSETPPAAEKESPSAPAKPASYTERLGEVTKWAAGALAAVAATAVTKLGLDRLGKGDVDPALATWAYVGLILFAIGVVVVVAAVIWHAHAGRVTLAYLLSGRTLPNKLKAFFDENTYLLGGASSLEAFRAELNKLIETLGDRDLNDEEDRRLQQLLVSRTALLETAARERTAEVSRRAVPILLAGTLAATIGAATFALATNRDVTLREDRLAEEERDRATGESGELRPKTPSDVRINLPEAASDTLRDELGGGCDLDALDAILLEVDNPPDSAVPQDDRATNVFHVVTERSGDCAVGDLWVHPDWVAPRPTPKPLVEVDPE